MLPALFFVFLLLLNKILFEPFKMKILRGSYVALAAQLLHKNMSVVQNIFRVNAKSEV